MNTFFVTMPPARPSREQIHTRPCLVRHPKKWLCVAGEVINDLSRHRSSTTGLVPQTEFTQAALRTSSRANESIVFTHDGKNCLLVIFYDFSAIIAEKVSDHHYRPAMVTLRLSQRFRKPDERATRIELIRRSVNGETRFFAREIKNHHHEAPLQKRGYRPDEIHEAARRAPEILSESLLDAGWWIDNTPAPTEKLPCYLTGFGLGDDKKAAPIFLHILRTAVLAGIAEHGFSVSPNTPLLAELLAPLPNIDGKPGLETTFVVTLYNRAAGSSLEKTIAGAALALIDKAYEIRPADHVGQVVYAKNRLPVSLARLEISTSPSGHELIEAVDRLHQSLT